MAISITIIELVECHGEKCKMDAAYCESLAGQIANNHGPEVYTYANDLRYYSSTQLPESVRLDDAIHILEHYGECCECNRKLTFPAEQVLSKHCESVALLNDGIEVRKIL